MTEPDAWEQCIRAFEWRQLVRFHPEIQKPYDNCPTCSHAWVYHRGYGCGHYPPCDCTESRV